MYCQEVKRSNSCRVFSFAKISKIILQYFKFVLVIVWTRVQLMINSRVVSTKTSKLSESVGFLGIPRVTYAELKGRKNQYGIESHFL